MTTIAILTPEEVAQRDQQPTREGRTGRKCSPARTRIIETYKAAMREAEPGYGADVTLAPDEDKRLVLRWLRRSSGLNTRVDERRSHQNGAGRDAHAVARSSPTCPKWQGDGDGMGVSDKLPGAWRHQTPIIVIRLLCSGLREATLGCQGRASRTSIL